MPILITDRSYDPPPSLGYDVSCLSGAKYGPVKFSMPYRCLGTYKRFSGSRDGFFVPGKFRANPVEIGQGTGRSTSGRVVTKCSGKTGNHWARTWDGDWSCTRYVPWTTGLSLCAWSQNLADNTLVKAYAKLKDVELDVATNLGELRETLEFIKNPLSGLVRALKAPAKKGGKGKKVADVLSTSWMQYRYAITPLLGDVASAMELLRKKLEGLSGFVRKRGLYGPSATTKRTVVPSTGYNCYFDFIEIERFSIKSETVLCVEMLWQNNAWTMLKALGLTPDRGLEVALELTKLSFVVEWFARVGDWLSAMVPAVDAAVKGSSTSQVSTYEKTVTTANYRSNYDGILSEVRPSSATWSFSQLVRRVDLPRPYLPPLNPNWYSLKRSLDSACLLHNVASNLLSKNTRRK